MSFGFEQKTCRKTSHEHHYEIHHSGDHFKGVSQAQNLKYFTSGIVTGDSHFPYFAHSNFKSV